MQQNKQTQLYKLFRFKQKAYHKYGRTLKQVVLSIEISCFNVDFVDLYCFCASEGLALLQCNTQTSTIFILGICLIYKAKKTHFGEAKAVCRTDIWQRLTFPTSQMHLSHILHKQCYKYCINLIQKSPTKNVGQSRLPGTFLLCKNSSA